MILYNDAYADILGFKHPMSMGRPLLEVWEEAREELAPIVDSVYNGTSIHMDDITLTMHRHGYPEETHFAFSYTPVRDEYGQVAGFFCPCVETTAEVLAERRHRKEIERQRHLFDQAPGFIAILSGPEHVFEFTNATHARLFGNRHFIGKPSGRLILIYRMVGSFSGWTRYLKPVSDSWPPNCPFVCMERAPVIPLSGISILSMNP
ncbi:PAS domain-containing protein [Pseudomonas asuensis]